MLARARKGDSAAYGELWRRHSEAGKAIARRIGSPDVADDLVAESFVRILSTIQRGSGPVSGFRPYLITTMRNVARRWAEKPQSVHVENFDEFEDPDTVDDPAIAALDRTLTLTAFRSLPERWQTVLWYSEVEGMDPHEIAPFLGMTPNATAALSYRARAGLREAWLKAHVKDDSSSPECRWTTERLSGYVAGKLTERERARVTDHLANCTKCTIVAGELDHIGSRLAFVLFPLLVGSSIGATLIASGTHGAATAIASAAPPLPAHIQLASFRSGPGSRTARTEHGRLVAAGAITLILAGAAAAVLTVSLHGAPASSSVAAPGTSAPAPSAAGPTATATPVPAPTPTAEPLAPVTPIARAVTRPKTPVAPTPQTAPVVVVSPASGLITNNPSPTLSGTGSPGATVTVNEGGTVRATVVVDSAGNWTVAVPLADGAHALSVVETAAANLPSTAVPLSVTVDTVAPAPPVVTTPIDNTSLVPFTIAGTAEPGATVTVYDNTGALLATVLVDSFGSWASGQLVGLTPIVTSLQVFQTDLAGNISAATDVGPIAPIATIVTPTAGATYASGTPIVISAQGWPGTDVQFFLDGSLVIVGGQNQLAFDASGNLSLSAVGLPAGVHTMGFSYTAGGQTSSTQAQVRFTVSP